MSEIPKRIREFLEKSRVDYEVIEHPLDFTAQETAAHTHTKGKEFAKTVFLKVDGKPAMAVLPAPQMVDLEEARASIGAEQIVLAHEDEIAKLCPDCDTGAAPPFGNLYDVPVYVSPVIARDERVTFNAGSHRDAIRMDYSDFERLVKPQVVSLHKG
jgi:Ala-tRNA(Pro) deacylase